MTHAVLQLLVRAEGSRRTLSREAAQTLAEYALLITLVAVGVTVAALLVFSAALGDAFDSVTACFTGGC